MRQLRAGRQEALSELYDRYGRLVFSVAARSLPQTAAEEIRQDVFLAVWRKAAVFTPERGTFRSWLMQIAHYRVLNELRRRGRRPLEESDPESARMANLPADGLEPHETVWYGSFRSAVESSVAELPIVQREALDLTLFENRTNTEVAASLHVPLGTAKTRIRAGLRRLRGKLAPFTAPLALAAVLASCAPAVAPRL